MLGGIFSWQPEKLRLFLTSEQFAQMVAAMLHGV
jgi:hypothetical protein